MIGKIKGTLYSVDNNIGLIETPSGLSYNVYLTPSCISHFKIGDSINVFTHLQVREDALTLFGFETKEEHDMFKLLMTVSGVGPKTAFGVVSFFKPSELINAIKSQDVDTIKQVPGLGKKTTMKIILELSQKLKEDFNFQKMYLSEDEKIIIDALISLGFGANEVKKVLNKIDKQLSLEQKIKEGLKLLTT